MLKNELRLIKWENARKIVLDSRNKLDGIMTFDHLLHSIGTIKQIPHPRSKGLDAFTGCGLVCTPPRWEIGMI